MSGVDELSIAVTHGNYYRQGGGEYVAEAIARTVDAPIYYGFGYEDAFEDTETEHHCLFDFPFYKWINRFGESIFQLRDLSFMWFGQHCPELHDYDVVIHSGNEFGWYVPPDDQTVIKYVHSTPRNAYDLFPKEGDSVLLRAYATSTRTLYRPTTTFPDRYICNSDTVRRRVQKYWGFDAEVLYPPIDTHGYGDDLAETDSTLYLTFNRLFRHKRTREIVKAFADLPDRQLVVGGTGPEEERLREIAPANVSVVGYLGEEEKRRLLSEASALLYNPINEDFGIIPIEGFASGTPVIGIDDGFTSHQIVDGVNGIKYGEPTVDAIWHAVRRFERDGVAAAPEQIEAFAEQFSRGRFERRFRELVAETVSESAVVTGIDTGMFEAAAGVPRRE